MEYRRRDALSRREVLALAAGGTAALLSRPILAQAAPKVGGSAVVAGAMGELSFHWLDGVEPPAETDFQQHHIGGMLREETKCRRGFDFKNGDRRTRIGPLAMFQRRVQLVIVHEGAAAGSAEPIAFVDPHQ